MPAFVLPQFLLCGLLVPRDGPADCAEGRPDVLPLSYAVDAMRTITVSQNATSEVLADVGIVLAFAVVLIAAGAATLRRRTP